MTSMLYHVTMIKFLNHPCKALNSMAVIISIVLSCIYVISPVAMMLMLKKNNPEYSMKLLPYLSVSQGTPNVDTAEESASMPRI